MQEQLKMCCVRVGQAQETNLALRLEGPEMDQVSEVGRVGVVPDMVLHEANLSLGRSSQCEVDHCCNFAEAVELWGPSETIW